MRIGFIGTGRIAEAVVTGLCTSAAPPEQVLLSPRNAAIAKRLAARFPAVRVAADNKSVIAGSEVVALSLRPAMAEEVLRPLAFHPGQRVLSLMALVPLARVKTLVDPAEAVRVLPLPTAARREGPVGPLSGRALGAGTSLTLGRAGTDRLRDGARGTVERHGADRCTVRAAPDRLRTGSPAAASLPPAPTAMSGQCSQR